MLSNFDELIIPFFTGSNIYLNYFFTFISYSVYGYIIFAILYFLKKKDMKNFFLYISNLIIGIGIITFLKYVIARPRPPQLLRSDPSFPSRHSFTSMFTLNFLYRHFHRFNRILLITYSILIPLSCLYLGVHYPSDVIIGSIIGLTLSAVIPEKFSFAIFKLFQSVLIIIRNILTEIKYKLKKLSQHVNKF